MIKIGEFKYKEETLFYIFDHGNCFFCEFNWKAECWKQFEEYQRAGIGAAFKIVHSVKTVEELKVACAAVNGNFHFEWEE